MKNLILPAIQQSLEVGERIIATQYGERKSGTVSQLGSSVVFVRFDDSPRVRWLHRASVEGVQS